MNRLLSVYHRLAYHAPYLRASAWGHANAMVGGHLPSGNSPRALMPTAAVLPTLRDRGTTLPTNRPRLHRSEG